MYTRIRALSVPAFIAQITMQGVLMGLSKDAVTPLIAVLISGLANVAGSLFAAGALGLINFGGAAYLGSLLADLQSQLPPGMGRLPEELGALQDLYPFLLAYAVAYVAVPAVRFLQLQRTNAEIDERNMVT